NGEVDLGVPFFPLIQLSIPAYSDDQLPEALAALPPEKPGSRKAA
ncbi:MAG TPA: orotate phosphoribosyltransferase, partial [Allosphingosinicella sp.]